MPDKTRSVDKQELADVLQTLVERGRGTEAMDALRRISGNEVGEAREIANGDYKYWAFISYSHKDADWGDWVHRTLEKYRVPASLVGRETSSGIVPKRVFPIFRDREELGAASELTDEISAALESSRFLVVICSVASAQSHWVSEEIKRFKSLYGSLRVLCIIVDGEPNAWDGSEECFPNAIRYEVTPEGELTNLPCEPIAADARPQGDGRFNAKLKLLSGLLGVRYDELRQREKIRRRRSQITWTSLAVAMLFVMVLGGTYLYRATDANRLVDALRKADTEQVPGILSDLSSYPVLAHNDLLTTFADSPEGSNAKLHAALGLLGRDDEALPYLRDRLLDVSADQLTTVRQLMFGHKEELTNHYWKVANDVAQDDKRRFHAACVLASYDPQGTQWANSEFAAFVVSYLVDVPPSQFLPMRNALRPVQSRLVAPLSAIYRDDTQSESAREFATDTLSDYLSEDAEALFDLLVDSDEIQFDPIFGSLLDHRKSAITLGNALIGSPIASEAGEIEKETMAIRKSNAAVMLMRLNAADQVWPLLRHSRDPRARSYIIHWLRPRGVDAATIMARCERETDVSILRALILGLGGYDLPPFDQQSTTEKLLELYRSHPDSGLHAAAEWTLRRWGQGERIAEIDNELQQNEAQLMATGSKLRWYVNGQDQTFMILDADEFMMGSPDEEIGRVGRNEVLHRRRMGRRIAICAKEVTHEQWRVFSRANPEMIWKSDQQRLKPYIRTDDSPMNGMTWYEAVWYCNWLSDQEGIPKNQWCYETNENGEYGQGMLAKDNFMELTGYRLPTDAEWEFACRAGAGSSRFYGSTEVLLDHYSWYRSNSSNYAHPVASLKPNDFGLYDMLGNVMEWCGDRYSIDESAIIGETVDDMPSVTRVGVIENDRRELRGGGFGSLPQLIRSASHYSGGRPFERTNINGFRPARTYHPTVHN